MLFRSSIEILHHPQSHQGQLNTLEAWTDNLQKLPNAYDEQLDAGQLNSKMNWSSLYLNKEKEENICVKILVSFQMCSTARGAVARSARKAMAVPQAAGSCTSVRVAACKVTRYTLVSICVFSE